MAHASRVSSVAAVAMFLGAVVAANMAVAAYGQLALVFTAWVVIPFDMLTRDLLHEKWRGDRLALRMGSLVLTGGLITVAINHASWRIAIASCIAFAMAMTVNSLVFERLIHRSRFVRMTASNAAAAVVDSIAFPAIAFMSINVSLSAWQAVSKTLGGVAWTAAALYIFARRNARSDSTH